MKLVSCYLSGAQYFEMSPRFSEICTPLQGHINYSTCLHRNVLIFVSKTASPI